MPDLYKVLGQVVGDGTLQDLYTPGVDKAAVVSVLFVSNKAAIDKTFRVKLTKDGVADSDGHNIYYDTRIPANDTLEICRGMTVAAADIVRVQGQDANVTFTLCGDEVS